MTEHPFRDYYIGQIIEVSGGPDEPVVLDARPGEVMTTVPSGRYRVLEVERGGESLRVEPVDDK